MKQKQDIPGYFFFGCFLVAAVFLLPLVCRDADCMRQLPVQAKAAFVLLFCWVYYKMENRPVKEDSDT
ncbi:hypothetical protein [Sediminibacterium ginsengisoli]|uniref:Uncharacterized protein n=1 Tax=Sediminibacterium ginsengisoli TaxID=413434 RepID=A0A1T4JXL2_9BACT|nr:hypothetical protein [Sediminibacterium ginsengisoli]SJZ34911.1 hypothetical protein SAMN04488132_101289 [Sediminibacterium ginsengisoli]